MERSLSYNSNLKKQDDELQMLYCVKGNVYTHIYDLYA